MARHAAVGDPFLLCVIGAGSTRAVLWGPRKPPTDGGNIPGLLLAPPPAHPATVPSFYVGFLRRTLSASVTSCCPCTTSIREMLDIWDRREGGILIGAAKKETHENTFSCIVLSILKLIFYNTD